MSFHLNAEGETEPIEKIGPAIVTIQEITVTQDTQEIDLPGKGILDEDVTQLKFFLNIKSLLLG